MKVKMLRRALGSDRDADGIALPVRAYPAGGVFELGDSLAKAMIANGDATPYDPVKVTPTKLVPPENKVLRAPAQNKRGRR